MATITKDMLEMAKNYTILSWNIVLFLLVISQKEDID
jgi:hypothetical protein